ncbi:hypothetical protein [Nocardia wallacei]|uniref:Uncharacterized protein n=1 Tax=Nocardia wallacei TaxID=480035 RepID=A0A7G1KVG4_9NOCA|nr:hypothetical protein [Nocardia wallacei]BCK59062.1 hypothetical protein NWFMUON74_68340 [Nocardia wallacei]
MATGVGLRIAEDECVAAVVAGVGEAGDDSAEPHYIVRDSVLHMSDDGDAALGGEPPSGHSHSITGFFAAVGDPAGISVDDGEAYRADDLVATALFCLINLAADHLNGPAEFYATHPADWPAQQVSALRDALDYLGLRSVVLVSEGDLPDPGKSADGTVDGRGYARDAARAALAAVLATPAGSTPPDPTHSENSLIVTDVLPALPSDDPTMQAYSAAMPAAYSAATPAVYPEADPPAETVAAAETAKPETPQPESRRSRRTLVLIAAAAVFGLVLGGVAAALLLRGDTETPVAPLPNARSEPAPTTVAPPPPPVFVAPPPSLVEEPAPEPETSEAPPPPPPTSETPPPPPPSTTTSPSRPTRTTPTTPRRTPTTVIPFIPYPTWLPPPQPQRPYAGIP